MVYIFKQTLNILPNNSSSNISKINTQIATTIFEQIFNNLPYNSNTNVFKINIPIAATITTVS